jgi:hypothetical protein
MELTDPFPDRCLGGVTTAPPVGSSRLSRRRGDRRAPATNTWNRCGSCARPDVATAHLRQLNTRAVETLSQLYQPNLQAFRSQAGSTGHIFSSSRAPGRESVIVLLGLRKLEQAGDAHRFAIQDIESALFSDLSWVTGIGDLGLLLWYAALHAPGQLAGLCQRYDLTEAFDHACDSRESRTLPLSWFLAGLSQVRLAKCTPAASIADLAAETFQKLAQNQGEDGIFSHRGARTWLDRCGVGRLGTFSDQAFSIYALAQFATAFEVTESLGAALDCASTLCGLQGSLGQWWWLYDSRQGTVSSHYPVCGINQAGIAPLALNALQRATGMDFQAPIQSGLRWIFGENELAEDFSRSGGSSEFGVTRDSTLARYGEIVLTRLGITSGQSSRQEFRGGAGRSASGCGWLLYSLGRLGMHTTVAPAPMAAAG